MMDKRTGRLYQRVDVEKMASEDLSFLVMAPLATFQQIVRGKVGRNEPCPCGSGNKFKKCCKT